MEAIVKIAGISVIAVAVSLLLKERYRGIAVPAVAAAVLVIGIYCIRTSFSEIFQGFSDAALPRELSTYTVTLTKALGISYITFASENLCRDAGESGLGSAVEVAGKAQLLLLSMPLIKRLLGIAYELL